MYGRAGLDRFKKAQSLEPFSVSGNSASKSATAPGLADYPRPTASSTGQVNGLHAQNHIHQSAGQSIVTPDVATNVVPPQQVTQVGGGQSTWQPPDWAIEPRPGVYYLDVIKEGEVIGQINLDKRKHIFGRQFHSCDFVLDHQSVSRQHAAVVPHRNGSVYVIDLGSAHGTFVANERLTKDTPVELEVGQSLRFAASTRTYILRKNNAALFPPPPQPTEIDLPPSPDPTDEEAVLAYNTYVNCYLNGLKRPHALSKSTGSSDTKDDSCVTEKASKRMRRARVAFKDQVGGELFEVVGYSDGADVETEPGPVGVKEGSLVGKYESLVQITVIPKGKEQSPVKEATTPQVGVTEKLKQVLNRVKAPSNASGGIYDDLYGESFSANVGGSWAYAAPKTSGQDALETKNGGNPSHIELEKPPQSSPGKKDDRDKDDDDDDDDLFG